jgi:CubicO group peptidase (beta-lactamase class C family)
MIDRALKIRISLKESRDNLDGDLEGTQRTDDSVLDMTIRPDWLKRGDFGIRNQFKRTWGRETDQHINISQIDFTNSPTFAWKYGLGWIYTDINEDTIGSENQEIHTLRTTLGWKKRFANDHLFRSTVVLDGNLIHRESDNQKTAGGKIDLGYDGGKYWSTDLSAGTRKTYRDAEDDGQYTAYELRASFHPGGDRSKALRLSAAKRQTFTASETTSTENTAKLSYSFSF